MIDYVNFYRVGWFVLLLVSHLEGKYGGADEENGLNSHQPYRLNLTAIQQFPTQCALHCKEQLQYNSICVEGCREWRRGLKESCGVVCVGKEGNFREFHACQLGCSKVVEEFYFYLTGILGVPDGPTLISSSLEPNSLGLKWEGVLRGQLPQLQFTVQKRIVGRGHEWETILIDLFNTTQVTIDGLRPYTEYKFRIGWLVAQDFPPLFSAESMGIVTLAKGLPSAPQITSVQPITNTSVSITWLPPVQPNGPLIAYILKLQNLPNGHLILKEIPIVGNQRSDGYTFSALLPNTNYSLSISVLNREGEGLPRLITFFTPQSQISNDILKTGEPKLLIQGIQEVYVQAIDLLLQPEVSVFVSTKNVTGMSAHFRKNFVFIATGEGEVVRRNLGPGNDTRVILRRDKLDIHVKFLSVDWLHDQLYVVGKKNRADIWTIRRMDLNGARIQTVLSNMGSKPVDFQADPYTGYLYWVTSQTVGTSPAGLYKMDLYQREHDPTEAIPLLEEDGLGPFTIDFTNYRILIVHKTRNTVFSVSLDGEKTDIRGNTQSPNWGEVVSIGNYGGVFYWTTGTSIVAEEYNAVQRAFYHNSYEVAKSHQPCSRLLLVHPSLQPTPAPMAPPTSVQAVFSSRKARVTWKPPPQIAGLGEGSWREWKYLVKISPNVSSVNGVNGTELLVNNLQPDTQYSFQVEAYSETGHGPSSIQFKGQTLEESSNLSLIWASDSGQIYSSDTLGDTVQPLHYATTADRILSLAASSTAIFFSLHNGSAFEYIRATGSVRLLQGVTFAQSMAFDPIGEKLYWSNPKKQAVLRWTLSYNETQPVEYLPLLTTALQIVLDSSAALMFWTNGHSVQVARLNGRNQETMTAVGLFSGVRILSISIDTHKERIFWLSRHSKGSSLYEKSYKSYGHHSEQDTTTTEIGTYEDGSFKGPIGYYSGRLLVLESGSEAMIQELKSIQSRAVIPITSISNISILLVAETTTHFNTTLPPSSIQPWSIILTGKWDSFMITWQPVHHSRTVFYDVSINGEILQPVSQPSVRIDNPPHNATSTTPTFSFDPYTEIEISITAATYWSSSKPTTVKRRTPSGKPSPPLNPRFFVTRLKYPYANGTEEEDGVLSGEIRWDPPAEPNGLVRGYVVHCWKGREKTSESFVQIDQRKLSAHVPHLRRDTPYHFGIEAYTDGGVGRMSRKVQVDTDKVTGVTKMLLTAGDKVEVLDIDRNSMERIRTPYNPHTVTYYALEETLFCFDEGKHLFSSSLKGINKTRILSLRHSQASDLHLNWISRKLYWISEGVGTEHKEKFAIEKLDLEQLGQGSQTVISSHNPITSIALNPFTSSIFWTTVARSGIVTLHSAADDGTSSGPLLKTSRGCNCSTIHSVGETVTLDTSGTSRRPSRGILFTEPSTSLIWLADEDGCICTPMLNFSAGGKPWKMTSDLDHVYWLSSQSHSSDGLYVGEKLASSVLQLRNAFGPLIREISAIGPTHQPFPGRECLVPVNLEVDEAILLNRSAHSMTLRLPALETQNCSLEKISLPTPTYSIYYAKIDDNGLTSCTKTTLTSCNLTTTARSPVVIQDLQPFTSYTLFFSATTYYSKREGHLPIFSSPIVMTTAPGPPLPPTLLSVTPRSPTSITVKWALPEKQNGRKVWYGVEWTSVGSKSDSNRIWAEGEGVTIQNDTEMELNVTKLHPGKNYTVWVCAYSELGDEFAKSELLEVETLGIPNNLTLVNATPHEITVAWTTPNSTHEFVYREGWSADWKETGVYAETSAASTYNLTVVNLNPKTTYGFRIKTWYQGEPTVGYTWPTESQFDIETLADKPNRPGIPIIRRVSITGYEVNWEKSEENGGVVQFYNLEGRFKSLKVNKSDKGQTGQLRMKRDETQVAQKYVAALESSAEEPDERLDWVVLYNGTECRWEVVGLDTKTALELRVRSKNIYGWSEYSRQSSVSSLSELLLLLPESQEFGAVIGIVLLSTFLLLAFGIIITLVFRRKQKEKSSLAGGSPTSAQRREVELATLRELPGGVHQNNILYAADLFLEFDSDGLEMPKVKRSQITLLKHLGSGAFGDVYEGYATNLRSATSPATLGSRVAIKTLRKGASTKEKLQFVEEARLMGQFHHPHILELLGICLDSDPCLVLELMSGGDLLSHLRSTRLPPTQSPFRFNLSDLVEIAVQVAKGCVYLEEKHFVHRDLAARNCLVKIDPHPQRRLERIVKIGDFGLARDVYRNDYYRKEGEGLLPVRWMPPESLVDGVFTTQSDVWSFGVLLWEILTLGQQPYPARSNVEVLSYVRTGGRLREPPNSPPPLSWLMYRCWEFEPQNRPTFKECLQHLLTIADTQNDDDVLEDSQNRNVIPYQNISALRAGAGRSYSPQVDFYQRDEDQDSPVFAHYSPQFDPGRNIVYAPENSSEGPFPKYLEVVGHWTEPTSPPMAPPPLELAVNDGYEIPVKLPPRDFGLPSPPPPYATTAPRIYHISTSSSERESGTEGRTLLGSTTSEEESWRVDEMTSGHDRPFEQSTNYRELDDAAPASTYAPFSGMDWRNRRTVRAMD